MATLLESLTVDPSVLVITEATYFAPGSTLPEGVVRIVIGPGGSLSGVPHHLLPAIVQAQIADLAYREEQAWHLRARGYGEEEVSALFEHADRLSVTTLRSATGALDAVLADERRRRHLAGMTDIAAEIRLRAGVDKALKVFVNEDQHRRYQAALPEPTVDAEAYRRHRAKRKRLARIARKSRRTNRR